MEKTKDLLYYIGDFLACIVILSLMYFLISWKLGDSLPVSYETGKSRMEATKEVEESKVVIESKGPNDAKAGDTSGTGDKTKTTDKTDTRADNKAAENKKKEEIKDKMATTPTTQDGVINFTIESGMSGVDIAYMLEEKGLVDSADLFIAKLESLDLASSLLTGDFELRKGMNYEEIANVLTGN